MSIVIERNSNTIKAIIAGWLPGSFWLVID